MFLTAKSLINIIYVMDNWHQQHRLRGAQNGAIAQELLGPEPPPTPST